MQDTAKSPIEHAPHEIDVKFYSEKDSKSFTLINNKTPSETVRSRNTWFNFEFEEPVYLNSIEIDTEGYNSYDKFHITVQHTDGTQHDEKVPVDSGIVNLSLGKLASAFSFKPDQKLLSNPKLLSIRAMGYTLKEFHELEWSLRDINTRLTSLKEKESEQQDLNEKLEKKHQQLSALNQEIGTATAELSKLEAQTSELESKSTSQQVTLKDAQSQIETLNEERREIERDISRQERKLDELKGEVRLFPSEISGFVKEGNRNIIFYTAIGTPFLIILGIMLQSFFSSAVDLTQLWRREQDIEIWTIFLTRLPYVFVALAIIETSAYVIARLIFEVMRINRQRLELVKLSIIAKDVATASGQTSELEPDAVFQEETKLRMQLLREHMANYPEQDFAYKGSAIMTAIVGVANQFANKDAAKQSDD